jgi:hypothetical protein
VIESKPWGRLCAFEEWAKALVETGWAKPSHEAAPRVNGLPWAMRAEVHVLR